MDKFTASVVHLKTVSCKCRVAIKGLSIARWPNATADECGHGDIDGSDRKSRNEHMLWSQTDLSLNAGLSFTNCPTLGRVA